LRNLRTIEGRLQYQAGSFAAVLVAVLFCVATRLWVGEDSQTELSPLRVALVCAFGAIGGFLSVSVGIRKLDIDPDADWWINAVSGGSRILIAVIGGFFIYLAVVSKLVLGFSQIDYSVSAILAISIVAGFSEAIVPNVIGRLASNAGQHRSEQVESKLPADRGSRSTDSSPSNHTTPNPSLQGTREVGAPSGPKDVPSR
jgi:hypothetical protein